MKVHPSPPVIEGAAEALPAGAEEGAVSPPESSEAVTPTPSSSSVPSPGQKCEARFLRFWDDPAFFPATVVKANNDGTYEIRFDDGALMESVSADHIRRPGGERDWEKGRRADPNCDRWTCMGLIVSAGPYLGFAVIIFGIVAIIQHNMRDCPEGRRPALEFETLNSHNNATSRCANWTQFDRVGCSLTGSFYELSKQYSLEEAKVECSKSSDCTAVFDFKGNGRGDIGLCKSRLLNSKNGKKQPYEMKSRTFVCDTQARPECKENMFGRRVLVDKSESKSGGRRSRSRGSSKSSRGGSRGGSCFPPGAHILLENQSYVAIENLELRDRVAHGGEVLAIMRLVGTSEPLMQVQVQVGFVVVVSASHTVLDPKDGVWKHAKDAAGAV
jgi:hypothetical protein